MGAMATTWNPTDTDEIIAAGMQGAERSTDGGLSWEPVQLPDGAAAVTFAPDGETLYAGVLDEQRALLYRSIDGGQTWTPTA